MTYSPGWGPAPSWPVSSGWAPPAVERVTRVTLAGVDLLASWRYVPARQASAVVLGSLDGWYDAPRDLTGEVQHWTGDGVVAELSRLGARMIRVRGYVRAQDEAGALAAVDRLGRARRGVLVVEERSRGLVREADVRQVGRSFDRVTSTFWRYDLTLQADDPLRYGSGAIALSNGAKTLVNRGDVTAYPVLDLVGPHSAITVAHLGGSWSFAALVSGQSRTVDLRNGDVWNGDVRVFGAESGPAPVVPAGGASWTVSGLGAGTARVRRTEAWT